MTVALEFMRSCLGTVCGLKDPSLGLLSARKLVNNSQSRGIIPKLYHKDSSKGVYYRTLLLLVELINRELSQNWEVKI